MSDSKMKELLVDILTKVLLFLLIFGMAATVDMKNMKQQIKNKRAIIMGITMQFLIMPLLGFISVVTFKSLGLTSAMGISLLIVTSSPGGSYSNWWCSLFNADLALSVVLTTISTILSTVLLPTNLLLYAHAAFGFNSGGNDILKSIDFLALFISLSIVIGAILIGIYSSYKLKSVAFRKASNAIGSISGIALIIVSAVFSSSGEGAKPWQQPWSFYVAVSIPCIAGLALSNIFAMIAKLKNPEVVTLSVECCYQNVGIAASAVLSMFQTNEEVQQAMCVPLFYGLLEAFILGLYCIIAWKLGWTKAPKDEKICIILAKSYEVEETDDKSENEGANNMDDQTDLEAATKIFSDDHSQALSATRTASTHDSSTLSHGSPQSYQNSPLPHSNNKLTTDGCEPVVCATCEFEGNPLSIHLEPES